MTNIETLYAILKIGRKVESEEMARKFALAVESLNVDPEYINCTGDRFLDLVAGALELDLAPHIIYGGFYCAGTDTERAHFVDSALAIQGRKLCPLHSFEEVRPQTANEALGELRSRLD